MGWERDDVKKAFLPILMGPNKYDGPLNRAFSDAYPAVAAMLHRVKKKDHRRASWLLQNLESTVFIHRVCGRLMREYPSMPVYTIHDSVYTTAAGREAVREVILDEFRESFGLVPTLKECE